ncbi:hypothetical protein [Streptomyces sp. ITFR-6]|uniref:hypothetical protein n=1 Tax=Streptomyces sp. ITFR-6 TaxID=3075197 RepID=UPI002889BA13|nr:hypothetical protein [Streptomyces sp. ITFR-6]WNI34380.1 hypothetical protein RLT59_37820 [Streptomyces sp. ITFR-6]
MRRTALGLAAVAAVMPRPLQPTRPLASENTRFTGHSTEEEHPAMWKTTKKSTVPQQLRLTDPGVREQLEALPASPVLGGLGTDRQPVCFDLDTDSPHVLVCSASGGAPPPSCGPWPRSSCTTAETSWSSTPSASPSRGRAVCRG